MANLLQFAKKNFRHVNNRCWLVYASSIGKHWVKKKKNGPIWEEGLAFIFFNTWRKIISLLILCNQKNRNLLNLLYVVWKHERTEKWVSNVSFFLSEDISSIFPQKLPQKLNNCNIGKQTTTQTYHLMELLCKKLMTCKFEVGVCEDILLPLGCLGGQSDWKSTPLRDRDLLRKNPSGFPVFWVAVPRCTRNGYGTSPNLWVQKKFVKFGQSTQHERLRLTEFFWEFLSYSPFDLFRNRGDVVLSQFWVKRVLLPTVPRNFFCFSRNCC